MKHKHHDCIVAWASGAVIQIKGERTGYWMDVDPSGWDVNAEYRIKPEPPKYPQTKMSEGDVCSVYYNGGPVNGSQEELRAFYRIANTAIARAIEDGDVVPAETLKNVPFDVRVTPNGVRTFVGGEEWVPASMLEKIVDRFAEKIANDFADRYPGPNGYSLMPSEKESIAASHKVRVKEILDFIIEAVKQGK